MSLLFTPIKIGQLTLKNRVVMSPMCQYSAINGVAQSWHFEHLAERAKGGVGTVIVEATGVEPRGRITHGCLGLWNDDQETTMKKLVEHLKQFNVHCGIQLAHAGRKASAKVPWLGGGALPVNEGGWETVAPSAIAFSDRYAEPQELKIPEISEMISLFAASANRAVRAGFDIIELHMAHGYLLHEFLSPLSNTRKDNYGGSFENRVRFALEVTKAVKAQLTTQELWARISFTDWVDEGWSLEESVRFAKLLKAEGVTLIDCSSGGNLPKAPVPVGPGYQVFGAADIKKNAHISTGAVGMITTPEQAETILKDEQADLVFLARELLRSPYWAHLAARELDQKNTFPPQYERAF